MNDTESVSRIATLCACALASTLFFMTATASAQSAPPSAGQTGGATTSNAPAKTDAAQPAMPLAQDANVAAEEVEEPYNPPLQVGDATLNLLAWQRGGEVSSAAPRPIEGNVANRSYERYLKSFEYPVPEKFSSSVKSTSGSGGK